jgi:hypothetical protein
VVNQVIYGKQSTANFNQGMLYHVVLWKFTDISEVLTASIIMVIALMTEAASTSET